MEVIERDKVSLQQSGEQAEIDAVRKLTVQVIHFQVDLHYNIADMII